MRKATMQRGEIRPWPPKNPTYWQLRYWTTELVKGKPVKKRRAVKLADISREYQTEKSVEALAQEKLLPLNLGTHRAESIDSIDTYLQAFLERGEGGRGKKLKTSTLGAYWDSYKLVQPYLPDMELRQVRIADIDRLLREVAENTEFAKTTYANLKNFLSSAFRSAARQGIINFNPVRDAAIPHGKKADTYAYSVEEVARMVNALKKHPNAKAAVLVAALTGLRRGEISGLRWADYDRKVQELDITRSVYEGRVQTTKTEASTARVPVIATVRKALANHLKRNTGDGYIFHDSIGKPMRFENFTQREVQPILKKAGIPWHGLHAFRRFLGTTLNDKGIDLETIKDVLRHSNNDVTKKSYIKPSTKRFRQMLEMVEKDFNRALKELKK
ncbi:MAG TPA: tyrosine-type recombinase/integrase [Candidatus Acidoferrum sp.]|nr:tyrosine-type recombinase/integrase [Candidatus Acidoferrum sp.]